MIRIRHLILFTLAVLLSLTVSAASMDVTCIVKDANGGLGGAVVRVKGGGKAVVTDLDGKAILNGIAPDAVLEVMLLGYETAEVEVAGRSSVTVTLSEDKEMLDEVVIIGYGTAKRKDYTGSVTSVRLENSAISLVGNSNALESLKGNVAGLDIGATNSAGGQPSMQLRGQKSISGSNSPLVVLDGVLFTGSVNDINPGDIASIEVLKDASSAAAFGSRSANGVVIITTKKGTSPKPVISFNSAVSVQDWANKPEMKQGQAYVDAILARNETDEMSWMSPQEMENYQNGRTTDWLDYISRTGVKQDYQISVSGSAPQVNYYLSTSYSDHKSIIKGDDFARNSIMGKISTDITSWMNLAVDGAFTRQDYSGISANVLTAYYLSPYGSPDRASGLGIEKYPMTESDGLQNPLWQADESLRENTEIRNNYRLASSLLLKCPWIEGLSFRSNFTINNMRKKSTDFRHEGYFIHEGNWDDESRYSSDEYLLLLSQAEGTVNDEVIKTWVLDMILNYSKDIGKNSLDFTLVSTRDHSTYDKQVIKGSDFGPNGNTSLGISGLHKASNYTLNLDGTKTTNIGYLARAMYSYDDRYSLTASFRRDGSSVFGVNNKWGNFYSFGAAWTPTSESFFPESKVLDRLKLKASWGKNGNQAIAAFGTLSPVVNGPNGGIRYEFNGSDILYGLAVSSMGNKELGWEATSSFNSGFESAWFGGRLGLDLDFYYSQTKNQIFSRTIPVMTGYTSMKASMGQVDNIGIEATMTGTAIKRGDFSWDSGLTFWLNRNKLVHLYGEDKDGDGREDDDLSNNLFIGKSLGAIYGYVQDGICQIDDHDYIGIHNAKPGNPKYLDLNGDDSITAEDRTILGYSSPSFKLNLSNNLKYKDFELYFLFTGTFGSRTRYLRSNPNAYRINGFGYASCNMIDIEWWTPENRSNVYPSASFTSDGRFLGLQNRTFVRLQDITLSYSFRQVRLKKAGIDKLMAYISAKNLLTFTKWVGDDPETGSTVLSSTMPVAKSVNLGINLSF